MDTAAKGKLTNRFFALAWQREPLENTQLALAGVTHRLSHYGVNMRVRPDGPILKPDHSPLVQKILGGKPLKQTISLPR